MNSHLSKTEYRIMEYFWSTGGKYTFGELMKYFNEEEDKNWKKQTLNTFLRSEERRVGKECRSRSSPYH